MSTEPPFAEAAPPLSTNPSPQADEYTRSGKSGKFRFKSSRSSKRSDREHRHRHHHHHEDRRHRSSHDRKHRHDDHEHTHRSSKRHKHHRSTRSPPLSPSHPIQSQPGPTLSADSAFRESLFDALGDDEGAAYWESVYGQPIHNYAVPSIPKGPEGELEQMDEEEYAAYVRTRMWERTREGMMEEQERLRAERARQRRREERAGERERERGRFEREVEESLKRGKARRRGKVWKAVWEEYLRSWGEIDKLASAAAAAGTGAGNSEEGKGEKKESDEANRLRNLLFWPVETGKRRDVSREAVEEFMRHAPPPQGSSDAKDRAGSPDLLATLKMERVRWHPDKIQHRYGSLGIDEVVMRSVTEVFQIVDTMWNELKGKQS